MAPIKHTAAVIVEGGGSVELKEIDVPKPDVNEVLIRVVAAALNPTDWKTAKTSVEGGTVSGCDLVGVVEELGSGAEAHRKLGERVATCIPGGHYAVQFAKLAGMTVYATCSPKNFGLVRSVGADEVFDYRDPDAPKKIKSASGGKLKFAVDTISELGSGEFISGALSDEGGKIVCILGCEGALCENVEPIFSLAYDLIIDRPDQSTSYLADGRKYAKLVTRLLAEGKLKPAPVLIMPNGLASVNHGFQYMIDGKVSGQKAIFRIADTPGLQQ